VSLGDSPERLILLDPDDSLGGRSRKIFQAKINDRNRARAKAGAEPLGYAVVGAGELARYHGGGQRTVRTAIDCLTEALSQAHG